MLLLWIGLLKAVGSPSIVDCVDACINVESAVWHNKWETCQICCIGDPFIWNSASSTLSCLLYWRTEPAIHFKLSIFQSLTHPCFPKFPLPLNLPRTISVHSSAPQLTRQCAQLTLLHHKWCTWGSQKHLLNGLHNHRCCLTPLTG